MTGPATQTPEPWPGDIHWYVADPVVGREQGGRRPGLVVSNTRHLELVRDLVTVVPVTTRERGWENHVEIGASLPRRSWAMTEQVRTISRRRLGPFIAAVDDATLDAVRVWLVDFLNL